MRACALVDGQDVIDIYAIVGGHNYNGDAITGSTAFDPYLEPVPLNTGERDVLLARARHSRPARPTRAAGPGRTQGRDLEILMETRALPPASEPLSSASAGDEDCWPG